MSAATAPPPAQPPGPAPFATANPALTPPKTQRRPLLIALAVLLITVGALVAGYLVTVTGNTSEVVAVRANVARGAVIQRDDLVEARINPDPNLTTVPASQIDSLVGRRAAVDLQAGGLVSPQSVTDAVLPAAGQALVGVALTRAQLPTQALKAGDRVRIVFTPRAQDPAPAKPPTAVQATVVNPPAAIEDSPQVVVDVTIDQAAAPNLAAVVATGRVVLVLDGTA